MTTAREHAETLFNEMVDNFSQAMKEKFKKKLDIGWFGWDDVVNFDFIFTMAKEHAVRDFSLENCVDVANLFCMCWGLRDDQIS